MTGHCPPPTVVQRRQRSRVAPLGRADDCFTTRPDAAMIASRRPAAAAAAAAAARPLVHHPAASWQHRPPRRRMNECMYE